jgi:LacI family transcriptional regulator
VNAQDKEVVQVQNKRVTTHDIAKITGFSRGTVDRALNNRGRISESTRKLILAKAQELGYVPNKLARSLALKQRITIGAIFPSQPEFFFDRIKDGMKAAEKEFKDFGLSVDYLLTETHDAMKEIELLEELLKRQPKGILLAPAHPLLLNGVIDRAAEEGIPTVTFNSDAPLSKRLCFIGQNLVESGRIAGELLGKFLNGSGKVAILTGFDEVLALRQRVEGFIEEITEYFPGLSFVGPFEYYDNEVNAYNITKRILKDISDLKGIYATSAAGTKGAGEAVDEFGKNRDIKIVGFDVDSNTEKMLRANTIHAAICQDPYAQGYYSVKIMFKHLTEGFVPVKKNLYTRLDILLRESIDRNNENNYLYRI